MQLFAFRPFWASEQTFVFFTFSVCSESESGVCTLFGALFFAPRGSFFSFFSLPPGIFFFPPGPLRAPSLPQGPIFDRSLGPCRAFYFFYFREGIPVGFFRFFGSEKTKKHKRKPRSKKKKKKSPSGPLLFSFFPYSQGSQGNGGPTKKRFSRSFGSQGPKERHSPFTPGAYPRGRAPGGTPGGAPRAPPGRPG